MNDKEFYFCTECKKHIASSADILFVEDRENKGFCSVECAEDFYYPIVRFFKDYELKFRKEIGLPEKEDDLIEHREFLANIYQDPQKVFRYQNSLGERFHVFIRKFNSSFGVSVAQLYQHEVSLVLASFATESESLVNEFKIGENITEYYLHQLNKKTDEEAKNYEVDEKDQQLLADLESKKSSVLADLLGLIKDHDIQIEDYPKYDYCFEDTFTHADEVYEWRDNVGDKLEYFIKSYPETEVEDKIIFFIVIALRINSENNSSLYPILGFPTIDLDVYEEFTRGRKISGIAFN